MMLKYETKTVIKLLDIMEYFTDYLKIGKGTKEYDSLLTNFEGVMGAVNRGNKDAFYEINLDSIISLVDKAVNKNEIVEDSTEEVNEKDKESLKALEDLLLCLNMVKDFYSFENIIIKL